MSETINKNVINNPCGIGTSCRSFQSKLNSNDPAIQYQIQKIILTIASVEDQPWASEIRKFSNNLP